MKRFFRPMLCAAAIWLASIAHGQTINKAEYFLDSDPGLGMGTPVSITPAVTIDQNFSLTTTGFTAGLHRLYIRAQQSNGLWSIPKTRFFYVSDNNNTEIIQFATDIVAAEYFYDVDPGVGNGAQIPLQKSATIDQNWVATTEGLAEGDHYLFIRTQSQDGLWGVPDTLAININNTICETPDVDFDFSLVDINTNIGITDVSTNVISGATYAWDVNNDGSVESTDAAFDTQFGARGIYPIRLTVTNPDGCSASILKDVIVSGPQNKMISLSANDSLIVGNDLQLTAPAGYTYEWSTGETTQAITVNEADFYSVYLSADGITFKSDIVEVKTFEALTAKFSSFDATSGLSNGAAIVENINSDGLPFDITWSTGADDVRSLTGLAPGSYSMTITTPLDSYDFPFTIGDITPASNSLIQAEYFIETDPGVGNGTPIDIYQAETLNVGFNIDASAFSPGLYKVYTRVKQANGIWSIPRYRHFYVIDPNARVYEEVDRNLISAEYFFDEDPGVGNGTAVAVSSTKVADIDFGHTISTLSSGLHDLYIRTKQDDGLWSVSAPITFFVIGGRFEDIIEFKTDIVAAEYYFDTDPGVGNGQSIPLQKTNNLTDRPWAARTDGLAQGDHTLNIRTQSQDGIWNTVSSQVFTITDEACVPPAADFAFDTVGVNTLIGITDLTTGLSDSVTYAWDVFGDGTIESTRADFDTTFATNGVYPLKLTVVNFPDSCFTSVVKDIVITDGLTAEIASNKADSLLAGDSITYTAPAGYAYEWNNGATTQSITVGKSGTYYAWLEADGISFKSQAKTVNFFEEITANLSVNGASAGVSNGSAALRNIFTDGLPYNIVWTNGVTDETQVNELALGSYQVQLSTVLDTVTFTFNIGEINLSGSEVLKAEYWFGADPGPGNGTEIITYQADEVSFDFSPDISGLSIGLQRLYIRAQQANGIWGIPKVRFFYIIDPDARVYVEIENDLISAEYFIDEDPGIGAGSPITITSGKTVDQPFDLLADVLTPGLHTIYVRSQQTDGVWSIPGKTKFFVADTTTAEIIVFNTDIVAAEYYFDEDPGIGAGFALPIQKTDSLTNRPWSATTAGLSIGKHKLNLRAQNQDGLWNVISSTEVFIYPSDCDLPVADFSFDTVGINTPIGLTDVSTNVLPGATYQWDIDGNGSVESTDVNFNPSFESFGFYPLRLTVTNAEGCSTSITKDVLVVDGFPGALALDKNDSLVVGDTLRITAPAGYAYEWVGGSTNQTLAVTESGNYYAFLTKDSISFKSEVISVNFFDPIEVTVLTFDATNGNNGAARLEGNYDERLELSVDWSTGAFDEPEIKDLAAGSYSVDISNAVQSVTLNFDILAGTRPAGSMIALEYFVDTDPGIGQGSSIPIYESTEVEISRPLTVTGVSEGNHSVYFRILQDNGLWSFPVRKNFYVIPLDNGLIDLNFGGDIVYAEYAFDNLPEPGAGTSISITPSLSLDESLAVDVSALSAGDHTLFVQMRDASGNWSFAQAEPFVVCDNIPSAPTVADVTACFGEDFVIDIVADAGNTFNIFDAEFELLASQTSTSYTFTDIEETQVIYVSQTAPDGCESTRIPVTLNVNNIQVFAGPDTKLPVARVTSLLDDNFPKGGTWSGTNFVTAEGIFSPSSAGLGDYTLTYTLDSAGCTATDQMIVQIREITGGVPVVSNQTFVINENIAVGTEIGTIVASDPDGDILTYFGASEADTAFVRIDSLSGEITVKDTELFNYEAIDSIGLNVNVFDEFSQVSFVISILINDINEAPIVVDNLSFSISENIVQDSLIGTAVGVDPEGEPVTFSILSGNELGAFAMDGNGALTVADSALIDFEINPGFNLQVNASDGILDTVFNLEVIIVDVNEAPSMSDITVNIPENSPIGTEVTTLAGIDPDGNSLTYSIISGNELGAFNMSNDGIITVLDSALVDFEINSVFNLSAQISDGTFTTNFAITLNVTDINEAPMISDQNFSIAENSMTGTTIGVLSATDPEGDALTFSILSGNELGGFSLSNDGTFALADSSVIDFETNPVFNIIAEVKDNSLATTFNLEVSLTDVNEAPSLVDLTVDLTENAANGTVVTTLAGTDPENTTLQYVILSGNELSGFTISNDQLLVADAAVMDFEVNPSFTLSIEVSDGLLKDTATVSINLLDVNERISSADSTLIVSIYENTSGDSWTNKDGWKVGPIADWYGITSDGARIIKIDLSNNNLVGALPSDLTQLSGVDTINFAGNSLEALPDLSAITDIKRINISENLLSFEVLEAITNLSIVNYAPQRPLLEKQSFLAQLGENVTINRAIPGQQLTYSWLKNGAAFSGSGAEISVTAESFANEGRYSARVTSAIIPDLTISTTEVTIRVSSLERDSTVLVAIYDALNGDQWSRKANWKTGALSTNWEGVTISNNRLVGLDLADNNLSGAIPEEINDALELASVDLSGNDISGMPTITLTGQTLFDVSGNQLDFGDLASNVNVDGINYSNQQLLGDAIETKVPVGDPVNVKFPIGGEGNVYSWTRNDAVVTGLVTDSLSIAAIDYNTMGRYQMRATNPNVPGLEIRSNIQTYWATADLEVTSTFKYADESTGILQEGTGYLFRITARGPYDSVQNFPNIVDEKLIFKDVILGDYILSVKTESGYTQTQNGDEVEFIPTYYISTIDNIEADPLNLRDNESLTMTVQRLPPPLTGGDGEVAMTVESEFTEEQTDGGRIDARRKVKKAGCSMRRFVRSGRLEDDEWELVAYLETDDEGQVVFGEVPAGRYRINIQYPGIPMDPDSFLEFEITDDKEQDGFVLAATVTEDGIFVELIEELGFYIDYFKNLNVYPNPANELVNISYEKLRSDNVQAILTSLDGKEVMAIDVAKGYGRSVQLDTSELPEGLYLLRFVDLENPERGIANVKIIVGH
ncbi:MAG: cadherin domain-containing protein [Cyclobacteriaceae bacterium]